MKCPVCGAWVECMETRTRNDNTRYRRYQCANLHRFATTETVAKVIQPKEKKQ